jgi:vacuolar-type H+-ATPase subunit E/Vma4
MRTAKPARRAEDLQVRSKEKVTKERMAFRARALSSIERYNRSYRLSNRQGTLQALVRYAEFVREASWR